MKETDQLMWENWYANRDDLLVSPSALRLLIKNPKTYYKHYVLEDQEVLTGKHFDEGSLLHCMVLEPEELNNKFVNMGIATPNETILSCINYVLELCPQDPNLGYYDWEILSHLIKINKYQSLKDTKDGTGDSKRLKKILTDNALEYFKLHVENADKTIVDQESWDKCMRKAKAITDDEKAAWLLYAQDDKDEVRYELEMNHRPDEYQFGIKGIMDCIKVSKKHKTIFVSDVKTTNKTIAEFAENIDKYDYWLQPACYEVLAKSLMRGPAFNYDFVFHFIVVDKNDQVYNFKVSEESLQKWRKQLIELVNHKLSWHIEHHDFELPYDFANNFVVL
tara:strand:+ start:922 stop:1926 length:1005 start_codon:yes stop_codon:yes gene_type:complete